MEYEAHNDDSGKDSMKSEIHGSEVQNDDSGKDRISELADDILHHILSHLPTKDIVRTSALSTRWRSFWTCYNIFTFDFDSRKEPGRSLDSVNRELVIPDNARLGRFRIFYKHYDFVSDYYKMSSIMELVSKAVKHQVEELDLTFRNLGRSLYLPRALFTCQSLTSLKLDTDPVTVKTTNLSSISLRRLRTLCLSHITFINKFFTEQLFAGCLVLEELLLYKCSYNTRSDITIAVPSLQRLSIYPCQELSNIPLIIRCPNLKFFKFSSGCWFFRLVLDLPSLVKAYIDIWAFTIYQNHNQLPHTLELFERIRGVESLRLSFNTLLTIRYVEDVLAEEFPTFHNLTRLKVLSGCFSFHTLTASALLHILHKSPNLQSIAFPDGLLLNNFQEKTHSLKDDVPVCLIHCLERFRVSLFQGYDEEVLLLKHILKHASVLKSFSVRCGGELTRNRETKEKIRLELKQLCNENCEFSFM